MEVITYNVQTPFKKSFVVTSKVPLDCIDIVTKLKNQCKRLRPFKFMVNDVEHNLRDKIQYSCNINILDCRKPKHPNRINIILRYEDLYAGIIEETHAHVKYPVTIGRIKGAIKAKNKANTSSQFDLMYDGWGDVIHENKSIYKNAKDGHKTVIEKIKSNDTIRIKVLSSRQKKVNINDGKVNNWGVGFEHTKQLKEFFGWGGEKVVVCKDGRECVIPKAVSKYILKYKKKIDVDSDELYKSFVDLYEGSIRKRDIEVLELIGFPAKLFLLYGISDVKKGEYHRWVTEVGSLVTEFIKRGNQTEVPYQHGIDNCPFIKKWFQKLSYEEQIKLISIHDKF